MAELKFGNSRIYERIYQMVHTAAALISVVMGALALFNELHNIFVPPIFLSGFAVYAMNLYDAVSEHGHSDNKVCSAILNLLAMCAFAALSVITIICFWVN